MPGDLQPKYYFCQIISKQIVLIWHVAIFQISIDIPRMSPLIPIFQQKLVQEVRYTASNTLRLRQNGCHFTDDIFQCIFLNENAWILFKISLKFVPKVWINNIPASVQIMAWYWPDNKPLSELMMVKLLMHICIIQPPWVKAWTKWPTFSNFKYISSDENCMCVIYMRKDHDFSIWVMITKLTWALMSVKDLNLITVSLEWKCSHFK